MTPLIVFPSCTKAGLRIDSQRRICHHHKGQVTVSTCNITCPYLEVPQKKGNKPLKVERAKKSSGGCGGCSK